VREAANEDIRPVTRGTVIETSDNRAPSRSSTGKKGSDEGTSDLLEFAAQLGKGEVREDAIRWSLTLRYEKGRGGGTLWGRRETE